jgi:hypothetical protein
MFRIMHVNPTDYEMSDDREKLQVIADELNKDARAQGDTKSRWIVIHDVAVGDLFK